MTSLSTVRPDFLDQVAGLQDILLGKNSWKDVLTTSTGETLLELIAAVGAYDQYSIQQALLNAFPATATIDSSVFAITQMLGIRLTRKTSVEVTVNITGTYNGQVISAYSQFNGAGSYWYNPTAITLTTSPQSLTLRQGIVKVINVPGQGTDYQAFISQEKSFLVSNQDVLVYVNGTQIPVLDSGLWEVKGAPGVQDITLPDGRLGLIFGSDLFGSKPTVSDVVNIIYAVTSGTDAATLITNGEDFSYTPDPTVTVACTSAPTGGGDEKKASVYKSVSSPLFGTFGSAVTKRQYLGTIRQYPGVVDTLTFAQHESNPKSLKWMNLFRVVALTETSWSTTQINTFLDWLATQTLYSGRFFFENAVAYPLTVNMDVYCSNVASLSQVQVNVRTALLNFFQETEGILGKDVYRSDLIDIALSADSSIDHVVLNSPSSDTILDRVSVDTPTYNVIAGGGTLSANNYEYAISYISSFGVGGQIAPANWVSVNNPANNGQIQLTWEAVPNVANYLVWGRLVGGTLGLIATLSNSTLTYTDSGAAAVVPPLLDIDTQPIYYATLAAASLTVTPHYSNRVQGSL